MVWNGQAGQDEWVFNTIGRKGFFVEAGAYDGVQTSNTLALERAGWDGVMIEANPGLLPALRQNRKCSIVSKAITNYKGVCLFNHDRVGSGSNVPCNTLDGILTDCNAPVPIDYVSLDIEGMELLVLQSFPFSKWAVKLWTIEHNIYCDGPANKDAIFKIMTANGYIRTHEDVRVTQEGIYFNHPFEDWYSKIIL